MATSDCLQLRVWRTWLAQTGGGREEVHPSGSRTRLAVASRWTSFFSHSLSLSSSLCLVNWGPAAVGGVSPLTIPPDQPGRGSKGWFSRPSQGWLCVWLTGVENGRGGGGAGGGGGGGG